MESKIKSDINYGNLKKSVLIIERNTKPKLIID